MKTIFRNSFISAALIMITACGFHLRNTASLPSALEPIYIGGPASGGALGRTLSYQLKNSNTKVTPYVAEANYQLLILSEGQSQRIISLDPRGLAAEYGITTSVDFELRDKQGKRVLGPQKIEERRTVTNNPDNALTTSQDIGIIRADMEQVLASQVVRYLGAYATHKLPADQSPAAEDDANSNAGKTSDGDTPQTAAPQN
jgi:LPS-assembly lipoprotein